MRPTAKADSETVGLAELVLRRIVVKRSQLRSRHAFATTVLHEFGHVRSGVDYFTDEFEDVLTDQVGTIAVKARALVNLKDSVARSVLRARSVRKDDRTERDADQSGCDVERVFDPAERSSSEDCDGRQRSSAEEIEQAPGKDCSNRHLRIRSHRVISDIWQQPSQQPRDVQQRRYASEPSG
jgi:hypothetical protein